MIKLFFHVFGKENKQEKIDIFNVKSGSGFSLTQYLGSFTPNFGLGTPVSQRISSNLVSGTPTFSKVCLWDSYFQNPSENPMAVFSAAKDSE